MRSPGHYRAAPAAGVLSEFLNEREATLCSILAADDSVPPLAQLQAFLASQENLAWALRNDVASIVARRTADRVGWEQVPTQWRNVYQEVESRVTAYLAELDRLAEHLDRAGIPLVALKNGGIARAIYPHPGASPMGDLDVLVEQRDFREAHQILLGDGYDFEFRQEGEADLPEAEASGGAEYWKLLPGGHRLWLELQWRPVAGRWIRPDQETTAGELIARSIPIPGTAVRLLSPEDNLLQVALHTAKHSYVRAPGFRLHLDVERVVRAYPDLDWGRFVHQAAGLQVKTAVYFSLAIPRALFATPIPSDVLTALRPAPWKEGLIWRQIRKAGLFNPDERKFSKPRYVLFATLLYDDAGGLWRGVFPDRAWMRDRYRVHHDLCLPYYYGRRLLDLALRRAKT